MYTILPHMVWPLCEFRMQVSNVLHAARCKYRTQKIAFSAPSRNFVGPYLCNQGMYWQSENSNTSATCPHNMVNFSLLPAEICWRVLGHPTGGRQPNFAALNRGRHLYSAGRPSRWALASISSSVPKHWHLLQKVGHLLVVYLLTVKQLFLQLLLFYDNCTTTISRSLTF